MKELYPYQKWLLENLEKLSDPNQSRVYLRGRRHSSLRQAQALHKMWLIEFIRKAGGDILESRTAIESALTWISSMRVTTGGGTYTTTKSSNGEEVVMGIGVLSTRRKRCILTCIGLLDRVAEDGPTISRRYIMVETVDTRYSTLHTSWESNTLC